MATRSFAASIMLTLWLCAVFLAVVAGPVAADTTGEKALAFSTDDPGLVWGPCPPLFPKGCEIAVLHGDPAQPNADVFYKVPAGYAIPHHWHTSAERMVLVSGELRVTYDGQDAVVLKPGTYAYGPAKAPHRAVCADGDACILFIAFVAPIDAHTKDALGGE